MVMEVYEMESYIQGHHILWNIYNTVNVCIVQVTGKVTHVHVTREFVGVHTRVLAPPTRVHVCGLLV